MSDLTAFEGRKLEKLLGLGSGYVLNFSDRTYSEFFIDYRIVIDAAQYRTGSDPQGQAANSLPLVVLTITPWLWKPGR